MFYSDNAISNEKDDELNRASFSKRFAEEVINWNDDESIVIAIYGDWGKGKTSILNIAISHIEEITKKSKKSKRPIIFKFNPWNFSEQESLLLAFLRQLFSTVNKTLPPIKKDFQKEINDLAKALVALGKIPVLGTPLQATSDVINLIVPEETLENLRAKVDEYFRNLESKVIIVIDDIDRLTQCEIRQLFQLIKINANFPNTIYLVAFDRPVVEKALTTEQGISGHDYLKKIIQVGFDIPAVEHSRLEKFLFPRLDDVLHSTDMTLWNKHRWGNLYYAGLGKLFESIRDIKRFLNSLAFNIKLVKGEINPVDFVGIEALRVFSPEVYKSIAANKDLFTGAVHSGNQEKLLEKKKELDNIFRLAGNQNEIVKNICLELFPQLRTFYPHFFMGTWSGNPAIWRKERRICSEYVFEIYFVMGVPIGEISQAELKQIASIATKPDELIKLFRKYIQKENMPRLLEWLDDILGELTEEGTLGLCQALFEIGDELIDVRQSASNMGPDFQTHRLLFLALSKVDDQNSRFNWFLSQINQSNSLCTIVEQIAWNLPNKEDPGARLLFDEQQLRALIKTCISIIETRAENGNLLQARNFASIVIQWQEWATNKNKPKEFVDNMISKPETALVFIEGFVFEGISHTFGDYVSKNEQRLDVESLRKLVDMDKLMKTISGLSATEKNKLSERKQVALNILLERIKNNPSANHKLQ